MNIIALNQTCYFRMSEQLLPLVILFVSGFLFSNLLIKALIVPLSNFGLVDIPGVRRAHKIATPRGGGLAISLTLMIIGPIFEYTMTQSFDYSARTLPPFFL